MRTDFDRTKLTPYQREVLTALARRLSKNEVKRFLQIAAAATRSSGVISKATQAVDCTKEAIEELEREHAAPTALCLPT